ncbi:hypothetical protein ACU4GD_29900 [Cupriavidus basilensis]
MIYIDPKAEMVIARFASLPVAVSERYNAIGYPAFQALADHLMANRWQRYRE